MSEEVRQSSPSRTPSPSPQSSSSTSSTSSRESSPMFYGKGGRGMSPFITPDKKLDQKKYDSFLKKLDVLQLSVYSDKYTEFSPKYPKDVTEQAAKRIRKAKFDKYIFYTGVFLVIIAIVLYVDIYVKIF